MRSSRTRLNAMVQSAARPSDCSFYRISFHDHASTEPKMTTYHEVFLPIFLLGLLVAGALSLFAGAKSGCLVPCFLLVGGTLALWAAMFFGSDMGYRAWQKSPNPPDEAFSDASVLGALLFGWFPAGLLCLTVFAVVRALRWLLHWATPDVYPSVRRNSTSSTVLTESAGSNNPYQSPRN